MSDMIAQAAVFVLGPSAIVLANSPYKKWAPVVGLASQPFWFWTTIAHHQWLLLAPFTVYTAAWGFGFYNLWIKGVEP